MPFPIVGHSYQFMVPQEDIWSTAESIIAKCDKQQRKASWIAKKHLLYSGSVIHTTLDYLLNDHDRLIFQGKSLFSAME